MYNYVSLKPHFRVLELLGGTGNGKTEVGTVPAEPKAAMIFSMTGRSLQFWIKPVAREVCSPQDTTLSSAIILRLMFASSGRKSIRSHMRCVLPRCLSKGRTQRTSAIRTR